MKKKLLVQVSIFVFLFNGCAQTVAPTINNNLISDRQLILGSIKYVERIQNIAQRSGNRSAFSQIMIDVEKNGDELDNNDPVNLKRFHKLVSSVIFKIGSVDMEAHYFRNKLNRAPKSLKELIKLNKTLPVSKRWTLVNIRNSGYHIQGVDGEYNLKFLSCDGYCEAVYNKKGVLLDENNDPVDMGTYNYAAGILNNISAHGTFDVGPYLKWGNSINSPQKGKEDISRGAKLAIANYKKHARSVYAYRKKLFGVQQGRVR